MTTPHKTRPQVYWETHVLPNYVDYQGRPADLRLALNAALTAFHMADYMFHEYKATDPSKVGDQGSLTKYKVYLTETLCSDFEHISDIANSHKHLWLGDPTPNQWDFSSTGIRPDVGVGGTKKILFNDRMGMSKDFAPVIDNVMRMWEKQIQTQGW